MSTDLTPLEAEILGRLHRCFGKQGFPDISDIRVLNRRNTGVGQYVDLESSAHIDLADGNLGVGKYSHLQMEGIPSGMTMLVLITKNRLVHIELVTMGDEAWDGVERPWRISDELEE
jgi:hypothetical protein